MTISSQTRKAGPYNGNGSTTTFPFAFKVFSASDVLVVRTNASGVETVLTLGTDYTVSLNSNQDSNAGGNVVMATAPASGYKLTIGSQVPLLQQTDFTNQGGFYPKVLNASLDKLTILTQQLQEEVDRSAKLPISNTADANTLTAAILQVANDQANIDAVAGDLANIDAVAGNATNINTVAGNNANVSTVAGISSDVTAVAGNNTNITAVKNNATNINTVAGIAANVTTVAGISANVTSVAGNATNINTVAGNNTNVTTVAGISTAVSTVATNATAVSTNATNISSINTNASNITAIQNASANAATATTQAGIATTQATAAAASAAAAAAAAASGLYSTVQDKSANYTIVAADAGDLIRVSTGSGAVTITLPSISSVGDGFKIAVVKWTSDANAVNIARSGSDTINGATSAQIGSQYSQIIFVADGETNTWFASQSGLGATNVNVDTFSGNGSTTSFTMSVDPSSKNNTRVHIGGVYQQKSTYSVSGTTLTFSTAPVSGTSNIEVEYATPLAIGTPSDDTVSTAKLQASSVTTAKVADGAITTVKHADNSVTYAKMQQVTAGKVLGRDTSGAGNVQELPIAVDASGNVMLGNGSIQGRFNIAGVTASSIPLTIDTNATYGEIQTFNSSPLHLNRQGNDVIINSTGGNLKFNSGYGSAATAYGCRAWVNFNGTGTVAIRGSGNVSSITDNGGTGDYNVNFTTALPDANYAAVAAGYFYSSWQANGSDTFQVTSFTTGGFRLVTKTTAAGNYEDNQLICASVFR